MAIPQDTNDGVLPPFIGSTPAQSGDLMSPYAATSYEVVERFALTHERIAILRGWLAHRSALRAAGFARGFQWIDGSFLETRPPKDIDIVTFLYMGNPSFADSGQAWQARSAQGQLFDRAMVKAAFKVDAFFIDLLEPPEFLVTVSRYYFGLFSHQRTTMVWKGMLQVRLEDNGSDAIANILLEQIASVLPPSAPETATPSLFGTEGIDDAS